jgi:hypothetical protein
MILYPILLRGQSLDLPPGRAEDTPEPASLASVVYASSEVISMKGRPALSFDHRGPSPIHYLLKEALKELIESGVPQPHERGPMKR